MERNFRLNWPAIVEQAIKQRKALKFSQRRLAAIAGISQPTLSRFEQCRADIQLSTVFAILDVLGMLDSGMVNKV